MKPTKQEEAWDIFNSLDRELSHHLRCVDNIIRVMRSDMLLHGLTSQEATAFLTERLEDVIEYNRRMAEGEIRRRKGPKSA